MEQKADGQHPCGICAWITVHEAGGSRVIVPLMPRIIAEHFSGSNRRFAIECDDGAVVEAVLYREDTLCISSQVGCAVRCPFCASGAHGLARPLRYDELEAQVGLVDAWLEERNPGTSIRRITVSGVGEPLHNFRHVTRFVEMARRQRRPASITTSGGPVDRLAHWVAELPHNGLTISAHAGTEVTRTRAVPKGPTLDALFATLEDSLSRASRSRRKKTAVAFLVIEGLNDSDEEIDAFIARMKPLAALDVWANLYAYNEVPTSALRPITRARYEQIYRHMMNAGLRVRMSSQARTEPNGGCGTLVALRAGTRQRATG